MKFWLKFIAVIGTIAAVFYTITVWGGFVLAIVDDWICRVFEGTKRKIYRVLSCIGNCILVLFAGMGIGHFGNWLIGKAFKKELEAAK